MAFRRVGRWVAVVLVVAVVAAGCQIPGSGPSSERVAYDGAGRLSSVMAGDGTTAVVRYDPLGNVVAVDRVAKDGLAVTSVAPSGGRPGDSLWVYGPGLGGGGESVSVGGAVAVVDEAVPGRLRVTVPSGAVTGSVEVSVGSSTVAWDGTFVRLADPPTITSISTQVGSSGEVIVIEGSGFDLEPLRNEVRIGAIQAPVWFGSASVLVAVVPPALASGLVRVETEAGSAVSSVPFATLPSGVDPNDACVSAGSVGAPVATSCEQGLATIDGVAAGGVYDVRFPGPCTGPVGPGRVWSPDGRLLGQVASGCGGATVRVWSPAEGSLLLLAPLGGSGGGGSGEVVDCPGCTPPDPHPVTNNPFHLCTCFELIAHAVIDAFVGRNRWDCLDCDPVDLASGQFVEDKLDLSIGDPGASLALTRSYSSSVDSVGPFGVGGSHSYDMFLSGDCGENDTMWLNLPNGGQVPFERFGGGYGCGHLQFLSTVWDRAAAYDVGEPWFGSVLTWHGAQAHGGYARITRPDGTVLRFSAQGSLERITDRTGATTTIVRRARTNGAHPTPIQAIVAPTGRWLAFEYHSDCDTSTDECRITTARDSAGRSVAYAYDSAKRLVEVTDAGGRRWEYRYEDSAHPHKRTHVVAQPEGVVVLENFYDSAGRVERQLMMGQNPLALPEWTFDYTESGGQLVETEMTNPAGVTQRVEMDSEGWVVLDERQVGTPYTQTTTYERQSGSGLVTRSTVTDGEFPSGRDTHYSYNPSGTTWTPTGSAIPDDHSLASVTVESAGGDLTESWTYAPWSFGQPRTHTAPGATTATVYDYDARGNLTSVTDPDGYVTTITPGPWGLPAAVKAAAATNETVATWEQGKLMAVTDAAGDTVRFEHDAVGRTITTISPAGNRHQVFYNPDNTISAEIDALGAPTTYEWGRWGLESMTAPGTGGTTSFAYNGFGQVATRTDPFGETDTWTYSDDGRVIAHSARDATVTEFGYQPGTAWMDRIDFGVDGTTVESSVEAAWDQAGRMTDLTDTTGGSVAFSYDDLDRIVAEQMVHGTVTYGYHPGDARLASVTPNSEPATLYAWSEAGRLQQVTRGTETTTYDYDSQGRFESVTYPSGAGDQVTLDDAGRLTNLRINHVDGGTPSSIDWEMTWGPDGHIETLGNANPYRVTPEYGGAAHDRYRLTDWNGDSLAYDDLGNLTEHGDNTYAWNARGELVEITGPDGQVAHYTYDALGRRTQRNLDGDTVRYLHRRDTPITEYDGQNNVIAQYTLGPGLDDRLAQHTTQGTAYYHRDHLGSTRALSDHTGTLVSRYTYTPQGQTHQTQVEGTDHRTDYRYAGLADDPGTGLIHMRARYYNPKTSRFISEDPLGIAAGPNPYQYMWGNPLAGTDPHGTIGPFVAACLIGAATGAALETLSSNKTTWRDLGRSAALGCIFDMAIPFASKVASRIGSQLGRATRSSPTPTVADDVASKCRSFSADTKVLMADGTAKRIDEVKVGEEVIATEPESGRSSVRRVLATLPHADYLLALRTSAGQIMTTEDHYFWNATDLVWQESRQLDAGDRLLAAGSGEVLVEGINLSTISYDSAYDLTIEGVHTYYVGVGDQYVLVHNADCGRGIWEITKEGTDRTLRNDRFGTFSRSKSDGLWWSKDQAGHGGSAWKVFEERGDGLHWIADADEYGDFIVGKHKSPTGQFIPWDELN